MAGSGFGLFFLGLCALSMGLFMLAAKWYVDHASDYLCSLPVHSPCGSCGSHGCEWCGQ